MGARVGADFGGGAGGGGEEIRGVGMAGFGPGDGLTVAEPDDGA